jgi:glycosyltransferase involved in cell wall biosynthesis
MRTGTVAERISEQMSDDDVLRRHGGSRVSDAPPRGRRIKLMLAIDGLGLGGAEMVVRDLARSLDAARFEVCVCCTRGLGGAVGQELLRDGVDVFVLPGQISGRTDYLTSLKFARVIKERHIDIVHSHAMAPLFDATPCRLMMPRLRVVHTFHFGNYPYDSWRYHLMEGLCARAADKLIAVGWEQRRRLHTSYQLRESRIGVIWNGVTIAPADPDAAFRAALGKGDRLVVGTVAKLIEQKGLDDLIKVAARCRDAGHRMQFVIVGEGPLRPMLEQQRHELGLDDTVTITGWIPNAAARAVPVFDVFFQPSRWEAMSIAILEAMACQKAIVATRVGDNAHVLEDGVSGLVVDSGNIDAMADALGRLRDNRLREAFGEAARRRFDEKFALQRMIRSYEQVYRELMDTVQSPS